MTLPADFYWGLMMEVHSKPDEVLDSFPWRMRLCNSPVICYPYALSRRERRTPMTRRAKRKAIPSTLTQFRRHRPVRTARKKRIWQDWRMWKAAKQEEVRQQRSRGGEDPDERAKREEECNKGHAKMFHDAGGSPQPSPQALCTEWVQDVHGRWLIIARPGDGHTHQEGMVFFPPRWRQWAQCTSIWVLLLKRSGSSVPHL